MRPAVIGIAGPARSGKDTICTFVITAVGGYRYSMADPIRAMLSVGVGIDMTDPYWQDRKEAAIPALGRSPREMMQTLGTEWGRMMVSPEIWLLQAQARLLDFGPGMVVPDIRFPNEATWVRKYGALLHVRRKDTVGVSEHASEAGIEPTEHELVIHNDGTFEELQEVVKKWLRV